MGGGKAIGIVGPGGVEEAPAGLAQGIVHRAAEGGAGQGGMGMGDDGMGSHGVSGPRRDALNINPMAATSNTAGPVAQQDRAQDS